MSATNNIIFSGQVATLKETLTSLRKSTLTITNRLESIVQDSEFVRKVGEAYNLPLVANARCGSWYIPTNCKAGSAYFKSTDGHTNQWSFNLRRLNLQLFDVLANHDGCVIVDSTRRGKSMPDAFSKTVPIWCCVMNRALFPDDEECHGLYVPPQVVSDSEMAQIEERLDSFVSQLKGLEVDLDSLKAKVRRPLRPLWITRDTGTPDKPCLFESYHTLVLCTSSKRVDGSEITGGGYIQGAGDDNESWSKGLTPPVFWKYQKILSTTPESQLPNMIKELVQKEQDSRPLAGFRGIEKVPQLLIGTLQELRHLAIGENDVLITCGHVQQVLVHEKRHLNLACREGKLGSRDIRAKLPELPAFLQNKGTHHIYVAGLDMNDLSIGICLIIICLYFDEEKGKLSFLQSRVDMDKMFIKQRLNWITNTFPESNIPRTTLQSVNDFLLSKPRI